MYGTLAVVLVLLLVGIVVMNYMTKKGFLNELETNLELADFVMKFNNGGATVKAKWKGIPFEIKANMKMFVQQSDIYYSTEHRFGFSANVTPGPGLTKPATSKGKEKATEEAGNRPWRVKLTAEEQKIIDARRGTEDASAEVELDKFVVRSNNAAAVTKYMQVSSHAEALEELFKIGINEVRITGNDITLVKNPYDNNDMLPKRVEKYLVNMRALIN